VTRVLVVDNYDSFAYNLVQYLGSTPRRYSYGATTRSTSRASVTSTRTASSSVQGRVRPTTRGLGPRLPGPRLPDAGVCLGHQALCAANGADVGHAPSVVHGKPSTVRHDGQGLFTGLPERVQTGRYHSLSVLEADLPDCLEPTAWTDTRDAEGVVMAVRHRERPHAGVQFHPESILTPRGKQMASAFLDACNTT